MSDLWDLTLAEECPTCRAAEGVVCTLSRRDQAPVLADIARARSVGYLWPLTDLRRLHGRRRQRALTKLRRAQAERERAARLRAR